MGGIELAALVIIGIIALIVAARSKAAATRDDTDRHTRCAEAMGGRVIEPFRDREVARYAGTMDGIEWTLRVVSIDDVEAPRNTTLIWETDSVRSDRVLAIVGNDINSGQSMLSQLSGSGYRLDVDPTVDIDREMARTNPAAREIEELRKREPDPQRWFAAAQDVARRHGIDGRPPAVITFGQSAHEVTSDLGGLPVRFRAYADDHTAARRIVSPEVIATIARWHSRHQGFLRIWAGGPHLRFMLTEINWPPAESFRHLLDLGLLLAQGMMALSAEAPTIVSQSTPTIEG
jgi:hypothetical protein